MAIGFPTKANWSAGDILTAAQMDDLAGTVNLLQNSAFPVVAGKNAVINGGMDFSQRGSSFASASVYTFDRWWNTASNITITQDSTTFPIGTRYAMKLVTSASAAVSCTQSVETLNATLLAGQTVTLSAYFNSSVSATGLVNLYYSTSSDVAPSGSWTSITATSGGSGTITNAFSRVSGVFAVPSTARALLVQFQSSTVASGTTIYVSGVQLELGSTATTFSRAGGSIGGELALCLRYYRRYTGNAGSQNPLCSAFAISTVSADGVLPFSTPMRVAPTSNESAVADLTFTWSAGTSTTGAVTIDLVSADAIFIRLTTTGLTAGQGGYFRVETGTSKYFELSAEL